jgi:hypothetical protein
LHFPSGHGFSASSTDLIEQLGHGGEHRMTIVPSGLNEPVPLQVPPHGHVFGAGGAGAGGSGVIAE